MTRLTYALSGKKAQYQHELFSDNYHEEYCRAEKQGDGSFVVESKDKGLFGVRGGLPNFILDWLKLSFHRGNEAFLSFLTHFEQRLVELRHEKAQMASIVYRAERLKQDEQGNDESKAALANQYFAAMNFEHPDYNIIPSTLLNRHAGRSITSIHRMLGYYFPYQFEIESGDIEWKVIAPESRSQLGKSQLGRGLVLGKQYAQLSRKITVKIIASNATQFQQFSIAESVASKHLEKIRGFCRQCLSEHAHIDVIAQYQGERVNNKALTKQLGQAIVLGSNAQLLARQDVQLQQIRKH